MATVPQPVDTGPGEGVPIVEAARPGRAAAVADALRRPWREDRAVVIAYLVLLTLVVVYAAVQPGVLTTAELNVQVNTALALILVTAGQTIVMLSGGLDLSVGAIVSLATCVAATRMKSGADVVPWVVLILAAGAGAGLVNGVLVAYGRLASFIVTLATWSIYSGFALLVLEQPGGTVPESYVSSLTGTVGAIGVPVVILAGGVCFWLWFRRTRTVSRLRAVGSSAESARLAGISVARSQVIAFVICGLLAAAGGLFLTTQLGAGDPLVGNSFVLQSVAAAVIGGAALSGGRGDVLGAVAGALVISLLGSVVFALALPSYWQIVAAGLLLIAVALANAVFVARGDQGEG